MRATRATKVGDIWVDNRIFTTKFCCDYEVCKGACCNQPLEGVSLSGGSLSNKEAAEILYHRRALSLLCEKEDQQIVLEQPVVKEEGLFYTTLRKDKCVLCNMKQGGCSLKVAKVKGITDVGIPLSCQLYPIIVDEDFTSLELSDLFDSFCKCAYEKGEREGVYLIDFLKVPLIRGFGELFFEKLKVCQNFFLHG